MIQKILAKMRPHIWIIMIGVLFALTVAAFVIGFERMIQIKEQLTLVTTQQEQVINVLALVQQRQVTQQQGLEKVAGVADALLVNVSLLRTETAQQFEAAGDVVTVALGNVEDELRNEFTESLASSQDRIASLIEEWENNVALVECGEGASQSQGSGVLFNVNGITSLVTNLHVITDDDDVFSEQCDVTFPNGDVGEFVFTPDDVVQQSMELDFALVQISEPSAQTVMQAKSDTTWCSTTPETGAQIIAMGYPTIGAKGGLTVTEGIISGYDDEYFISSVKVDRGNSGGAAIWVEQDCYLGIPTKVYAGVAETLARILDIREVEISL